MAIEHYNLTFNKQMAGMPIIYNLGKKYELVTNLERANISEEAGWIQISLNGAPEEIQRAVADISAMGIFVTPVELATFA